MLWRKRIKAKKEKPKEDEAKTAELRRQQQIAAKAELRKRMEEESHISKMNSLKIESMADNYENVKSGITQERYSQNHERDVDRKAALLQMMDRHLEKAESNGASVASC